MPEIYHHQHPYYSPGDGKYQGPSFMHQLIFGEGLEYTFPEQVNILTSHHSEWFHMNSDWPNKRSEDFYKDIPAFGEFVRNNMVGDVFITPSKVEYYFPQGDDHAPWKADYKDFFKTHENGKLIRLPVHCVISYISIRFRNEVDKTQFLLLNDGQFKFMDELEQDRIKKSKDRYYEKTRHILCPLCKVNYDDSNNTE